jgi:hypothetical protein
MTLIKDDYVVRMYVVRALHGLVENFRLEPGDLDSYIPHRRPICATNKPQRSLCPPRRLIGALAAVAIPNAHGRSMFEPYERENAADPFHSGCKPTQ